MHERFSKILNFKGVPSLLTVLRETQLQIRRKKGQNEIGVGKNFQNH